MAAPELECLLRFAMYGLITPRSYDGVSVIMMAAQTPLVHASTLIIMKKDRNKLTLPFHAVNQKTSL
jgi:hypothetical protein